MHFQLFGNLYRMKKTLKITFYRDRLHFPHVFYHDDFLHIFAYNFLSNHHIRLILVSMQLMEHKLRNGIYICIKIIRIIDLLTDFLPLPLKFSAKFSN